MQLPPPSKAEMLREIDRELEMRQRVYPKEIAGKRLDARTAARRMEILRAIRAVVERAG